MLSKLLCENIRLAGNRVSPSLATKRLLHNRTLGSLATNPQHISSTSDNYDDPDLWVRSPYPDIPTIDGITMHEIVWSSLGTGKNREQRTALECGITGRKYTFGELYKYSKGFGAALMNAGYRRGHTIGVVLPNMPEYAIVQLGSWEAGLTISPVNPAYTEAEIRRQLESSEVSCAVTVAHFLPAVLEARKTIPKLKDIIVIGDAQEGCHSFSEMIKTSTLGVQFYTGKDIDVMNDIAVLPYSSGTTGPPKGVMLTHHNIVNCFNQFNQPDIGAFHAYDDNHDQERTIGLLPFFHSYGFSGILTLGIYLGSNCLTLPRFEPVSFIKAVRQHKPTALHLVTPLISFMVNSPEFGKEELKDVHAIIASAAPIGKSLANRFLEKAEKYIFFQEGYGMTELSPVSHIMNPSVGNSKIGSCGRPIVNTITKLIDIETGKTVGRNQRGEICVKGPQVMKGYFKNEEATKATIDADGWLHTGDIAYHDNDGFCFIVDRLKELIKVKGFQVAPSELEDILRKHPKITDVAVIGVPNEDTGEAPRAYIVRNNESLDSTEVHDYLEEKVSSFKQLKGGIEFVTAIPKAPSGKILRRELILAYRKEHGIDV